MRVMPSADLTARIETLIRAEPTPEPQRPETIPAYYGADSTPEQVLVAWLEMWRLRYPHDEAFYRAGIVRWAKRCGDTPVVPAMEYVGGLPMDEDGECPLCQ